MHQNIFIKVTIDPSLSPEQHFAFVLEAATSPVCQLCHLKNVSMFAKMLLGNFCWQLRVKAEKSREEPGDQAKFANGDYSWVSLSCLIPLLNDFPAHPVFLISICDLCYSLCFLGKSALKIIATTSLFLRCRYFKIK